MYIFWKIIYYLIIFFVPQTLFCCCYLVNCLSNLVILCRNTFRTPSLPNRRSWIAEILREGLPPSTSCHASHVACNASHVLCPIFFGQSCLTSCWMAYYPPTCHVSRHMSFVTCHVSLVFFGQNCLTS